MGRNRANTWASRYTGRACSMLARLGETRRPRPAAYYADPP